MEGKRLNLRQAARASRCGARPGGLTQGNGSGPAEAVPIHTLLRMDRTAEYAILVLTVAGGVTSTPHHLSP